MDGVFRTHEPVQPNAELVFSWITAKLNPEGIQITSGVGLSGAITSKRFKPFSQPLRFSLNHISRPEVVSMASSMGRMSLKN